jgi:hypothetical protein
MTEKQKKYLKDYRNKIQTKRLTIVLPMEIVDWVGSEVERRQSPSFTACLIEIIKERKEHLEN